LKVFKAIMYLSGEIVNIVNFHSNTNNTHDDKHCK
jgi:hypothetical protein